MAVQNPGWRVRTPHLRFETPAEDLLRPAALVSGCVLSASGTWERGMLAGLLETALLPLDPFEPLLTPDLPEGRLACEASGLHLQHGSDAMAWSASQHASMS